MLRSQAISEVQEILGFRTDQVDRIIARLQRTQRLLEQGRTLPWFLKIEDYEIVVPADGRASLPSNFIREVERRRGLYFKTVDGSAAVWLRKLPYEESRRLYGFSTAEYPQTYLIEKEDIQFFPALENEVTFYFPYYAHDEPLTSEIENDWLKHAPEVLIGNAALSMARTLHNDKAAAEAMTLAQTAWDALMKETTLREIANREFILGRREY